MFTKTFPFGSDPEIKTPKVNSMNEVKVSSEQTANCIKSKYEYPNGLIFEIEQYFNKIILTSNKELVQLEDGTYTFKD